jgi:hypothetical protein
MSELNSSLKRPPRDLAWLVAIFLSALVVRLLFAWQYARAPLGQYPWVDESSYWTWAQAILRGGWLPIRPFYQDPLYPYWLACLMAVIGTDVATLRIVSAGLGAITPVAIALVGRAGLGRAQGIVAGWLSAFYAPLVFADASLEKEGLAAFLTVLALGLTGLRTRSVSLAMALGGGGAWGAAGLLRSNALVIAPAAIVWLAWFGTDQSNPSRVRRLATPLGFLAGFLAVLLPVAAVNTAVSSPRELLGTTWQLGPNFYIGNGPGATGTYRAPPFVRGNPAYEAADYAMEAMRRANRPLSAGEVSRFWLIEGLKPWAESPLGSLRLLIRKLGLLTHRSEIPDNEDIEFVTIVAAPALSAAVIDFGILFPLAVIGLAHRPRTPFWLFLNLATWLGMAATALFFVVGRYRIPWVPGLALMASAGLVDLAQLARNREWSGLALRLALLGIPAACIAWRSQADPVPTRWGNELIALATAKLRSGHLDPAIDALDLARVTNRDIALKVRQLTGEGPLHDLLVVVTDRELRMKSGATASVDGDVSKARLLRQTSDRSAAARTLLEARLQSSPEDHAAMRELAALILAWPANPGELDRARALLGQASRSPNADDRAILLQALLTSNPAVLEQSPPGLDARLAPLPALVRAILRSRQRPISK